MTQTLSVNSNNDIYINKDGNLAVSSDLQAILFACEHAAKTTLGELILNTDQGIPYFQTVWNGVPNIQQFDAALRRAFLSIEGVVDVVSLMTAQEGDVLTYTAIIRTIFGGGAISG